TCGVHTSVMAASCPVASLATRQRRGGECLPAARVAPVPNEGGDLDGNSAYRLAHRPAPGRPGLRIAPAVVDRPDRPRDRAPRLLVPGRHPVQTLVLLVAGPRS